MLDDDTRGPFIQDTQSRAGDPTCPSEVPCAGLCGFVTISVLADTDIIIPILQLSDLRLGMGTGTSTGATTNKRQSQDATPDSSPSAPWHPLPFVPIRKLPSKNCDSMGFNDEGTYHLTWQDIQEEGGSSVA